jgi:alpha-L-fucosidase
VGAWVNRNADGIYGTSADPLPEFPWGYSTVKGNNLYLYVRDWPADGKLVVPNVRNKVNSALLLANRTEKLNIRQESDRIVIEVPSKRPDDPITVLELGIEGSLSVEPPVTVQNDKGNLELNYLTAITYGEAKTRFNRKGSFHISKWESPSDSVQWIAEVSKPGTYRVKIDYSSTRDWEGRSYEITCGKEVLKPTVIHTGEWFEYHEFPVGYFTFPAPGRYTIRINPATEGNSWLMYLRSIKLEPAAEVKKEGWGVN